MSPSSAPASLVSGSAICSPNAASRSPSARARPSAVRRRRLPRGIVHGGLKYALGGKATAASRALAAMPARWRACLAGRGDIDLRGVPLLAEHMHLFAPEPSARVRLFFGSRLAAGQCRRLDAAATSFRRGAVAEMDDFRDRRAAARAPLGCAFAGSHRRREGGRRCAPSGTRRGRSHRHAGGGDSRALRRPGGGASATRR